MGKMEVPLPPVLLICFDRPQLVRRALASIEECGFSRIYVSIDGPRRGERESGLRVSEVNRVVENFRQSADIRVRSHEENLGGGKAVLDALEWFFGQETDGIIWEEDCVLDPTAVELITSLRRLGVWNRLSTLSFTDYLNRASSREEGIFRWSSYHHSGVFWTRREIFSGYSLSLRHLPFMALAGKVCSALHYRVLPSLVWIFRIARLYSRAYPSYWDFQFTILTLADRCQHAVVNGNLVSNLGLENSSSGRNYEHILNGRTLTIAPIDGEIVLPKNTEISHQVDSDLEKEIFQMTWSKVLSNLSRWCLRIGSGRG